MTSKHHAPTRGWDLRTAKPVVITAEVRGLSLFAGLENKELAPEEMRRGARELAALCRKHGITADRLGNSLVRLGRMLRAEHRALNEETNGWQQER